MTDTTARADARRRIDTLAALGVTIAAPAVLTYLVWTLSVDVPHWDEWEYTGFLAKAARGELAAADFFSQCNESRVAVGRLVILTFAAVADWNLRYQSLVAPALAAITLALLAWVGAARVGRHRPAWWLALAVTSLLLFSPTQDDNWMMALQHIAFVPGVCLAGVLVLAGAGGAWWLRWGVGASLAALASFSVPNGFVIWVLGAPALWYPPDPARQDRRGGGLAIWAVTAGVTAWFFFTGYTTVEGHPAAVTPFSSPARFGLYFFTFLGAPFARGTAFDPVTVAPVVGGLLFSAYLAATLRVCRTADNLRAALPWLVVGGYALAHAAAGAMLRSASGTLQALPSRYATYALALPVSLTWLAALAWVRPSPSAEPASPRVLAAWSGGVTVLLTLLGLSSLQAVGEMVHLSRALTTARAALPFFAHVPDTRPLEILYPRRLATTMGTQDPIQPGEGRRPPAHGPVTIQWRWRPANPLIERETSGVGSNAESAR